MTTLEELLQVGRTTNLANWWTSSVEEQLKGFSPIHYILGAENLWVASCSRQRYIDAYCDHPHVILPTTSQENPTGNIAQQQTPAKVLFSAFWVLWYSCCNPNNHHNTNPPSRGSSLPHPRIMRGLIVSAVSPGSTIVRIKTPTGP